VVVKGYTVYSDYKTVTVDNRGTSLTYQLAAGNELDQAAIGNYGKLSIDPITGKVTGWVAIPVGTDSWEILAVDKANGMMTLKNGGTIIFVDEDAAVIYKVVSGSKVYIGYDGIAVGGTVKIGVDSSKNVIFEYTPKP
jgi:hypothetical protein